MSYINLYSVHLCISTLNFVLVLENIGRHTYQIVQLGYKHGSLSIQIYIFIIICIHVIITVTHFGHIVDRADIT